jgi:hypothetical protein
MYVCGERFAAYCEGHARVVEKAFHQMEVR